MTTTMRAIYEDGKLVLQETLPLPEKSQVTVTIETGSDQPNDAERAAWLSVSEMSLKRTWENSEDDIFNELLAP